MLRLGRLYTRSTVHAHPVDWKCRPKPERQVTSQPQACRQPVASQPGKHPLAGLAEAGRNLTATTCPYPSRRRSGIFRRWWSGFLVVVLNDVSIPWRSQKCQSCPRDP